MKKKIFYEKISKVEDCQEFKNLVATLEKNQLMEWLKKILKGIV